MVLAALDYSDCLSDSPWFRQTLHEHDKRLEKAADSIKSIETQCRNLVNAAEKLSLAQRGFAKALSDFNIQETTAMGVQTDEEKTLANSIKKFASVIEEVEDQRMKILEFSETQYIDRLRKFRTEIIGKAIHHDKKVFEKASSKFYSHLDKYLSLSTVKKNVDFPEADSQLQFEQSDFTRASLDYVDCLQSVQERIKFEFVEILSSFMFSWVTFYHVGHVQYEDFKPYLMDVQNTVQSTKNSYEATQKEAEKLKRRILSVRNHTQSSNETIVENCNVKQGYLLVMEKKSLGAKWIKQYCIFQRETRMFTVINKMDKPDDAKMAHQSLSMKLVSCTRKASNTIDRRFCFEITTEKDTYVVQAMSDKDRKAWLQVMDATEPLYSPAAPITTREPSVDDSGLNFVKSCLQYIEANGLNEQGIYRNCGVSSKVNKVINQGLMNGKLIMDQDLDNRTVTSAVKTYLRNLPEPLLTFDLYTPLVEIAKLESKEERLQGIQLHISSLPQENKNMLWIICEHLVKVAQMSDTNLMSVSNLSVCFGPTLLRPRDREQSLTTCLDIKFCNVVIEIIVQNYVNILESNPPTPPRRAKHNGKSVTHDTLNMTQSLNSLTKSRREKFFSENTTSQLAQQSSADISLPLSRVSPPDLDRQHTSKSSFYCNADIALSYTSLPYPTHISFGRVRTLYNCNAENSGELSFRAAQIIVNVYKSPEPGWLIGTLNGHTGLVPSNFVQYL